MQEAIHYLKENGFYHRKHFFSNDQISSLKHSFEEAFEQKRNRFYSRFLSKSNYSANHDVNRWNMLLPSDSIFLNTEFYATQEIFSILKGVFDHQFALVFFSSDISSPGSSFQTIHQDGNDFAIALNVPLVDANEINGSTQIYPKTHRTSEIAPFTNDSNEFTEQEVIERAEKLKPLYLNVQAGDITLRDLRLIHRGTPNNTTEHRPYLSAIFLPVFKEEAPEFEVIEKGLSVFAKFKEEAFMAGRMDLIDYANTFGRLVMSFSHSDRVNRPIPKVVSDLLSEAALYCFRFAKFEDQLLNEKISRTKETSKALQEEIRIAELEFAQLLNAQPV